MWNKHCFGKYALPAEALNCIWNFPLRLLPLWKSSLRRIHNGTKCHTLHCILCHHNYGQILYPEHSFNWRWNWTKLSIKGEKYFWDVSNLWHVIIDHAHKIWAFEIPNGRQLMVLYQLTCLSVFLSSWWSDEQSICERDGCN